MIEKFALITAFMGIIALFILSHFIEPKLTAISGINDNMIGQKIMIHGNITKIKTSESVQILTVTSLEDNSEISVVLFEKAGIAKGVADIKGKVQEYNGALEIVADEIIMS